MVFFSDPSETKRKVHNYQVFLSNTTRRQEGSLCIDDTGPIFPLPGVVKNCQALAVKRYDLLALSYFTMQFLMDLQPPSIILKYAK